MFDILYGTQGKLVIFLKEYQKARRKLRINEKKLKRIEFYIKKYNKYFLYSLKFAVFDCIFSCQILFLTVETEKSTFYFKVIMTKL